MKVILAWATLLMGMTASYAQDTAERGRQLAERMCAHCHAIGKWERSPLANAPPFRQLEPRVDFDELQQRLQDGIVSGHPAMPMFIFSSDEARALVVYLRTIRGS
jgi:mono/diheme cytochrome c family protein